ncbi:MAG: biopolymer transporter ExbD [Acidobacteriaceae bacterium]|jgi:biopolymer transport protein TolR
MGMSTGGGSGLSSDINVTPLIDVLLVLLIIFMVIVPVTPRGLDALVPQPPKNPQKDQENDRTIVVQIIHRNGGGVPGYKINELDVSHGDLLNKLEGIFATRAEKVMFIKGDPELDFSAVADVLDVGHSAGVDHIGLITPKVAAGQ